MRLIVLSCFALGSLVACDDGVRRIQELEGKYHVLANRCLAVGKLMRDAWQCLSDANGQHYTYTDMIHECTGGGWFEGPQICGGIKIYYEMREDFPSSVITSWQVHAAERALQKGIAR